MVSVVIPAYNEEKAIGRCLTALVKQVTGEPFEVIVVDNASTDGTARVAGSYKNKLRLRIVNESQKSRGAARRRGFESARGSIILSTDADTVVPSRWIDRMAGYFSDPRVKAVTGTARINDCSRRINTLFNIFQPIAMRCYRIMFGHYWLSGFNFGIKKDVYTQSGGFQAKLNVQEDIELSFNVAKLCTIRFISDIPVLCSGRRFSRGIVRGSWPYIQTFFQYFLYHNDHVILGDVR
jgi:glycosyltransferase involved in cell wall biosynthesis